MLAELVNPVGPGGWWQLVPIAWLAVVLALVVLGVVLVVALIRFLLVATRAARLYVEQHEPRSDDAA